MNAVPKEMRKLLLVWTSGVAFILGIVVVCAGLHPAAKAKASASFQATIPGVLIRVVAVVAKAARIEV